MSKLVYTARETGKWLLDKAGEVPPCGLTMSDVGENPETYFPRDRHPGASWRSSSHSSSRKCAGGLHVAPSAVSP